MAIFTIQLISFPKLMNKFFNRVIMASAGIKRFTLHDLYIADRSVPLSVKVRNDDLP